MADDQQPTTPTGADLINTWLSRSPDHARARRCPGCDQDLTRIGISSLAYRYDTCTCDAVDYPHLLEQLWHLECMVTAAPDLAARRLLEDALHALAPHRRGRDAIRTRIDAYLEATSR